MNLFINATKTLFTLIVLCILTSSCMNKQGGGALIGAGVGGLIGSRFGSGTSQLLATGVGAIAGGLIGGTIGASLDANDKRMAQQASTNALEHTPSGQSVAWNNPDTGHSGYVTAKPAFKKNDGRYCREYTQTVTVGNKTQEAYGTACRQPDGTWEIVK